MCVTLVAAVERRGARGVGMDGEGRGRLFEAPVAQTAGGFGVFGGFGRRFWGLVGLLNIAAQIAARLRGAAACAKV